MSIALPTTFAAEDLSPYLVDFGGDLVPILGGVTQRIDRLGSRWAVEVTLPPMDPDEARLWVSRLVQAKAADGYMPWPQPTEVGDEGVPRVNGAGQAGTVLAIDGLPPGKALKEGWFFSVITGGRRYLYMIAADVVANASGGAVLTVEPMLRTRPADNAVIELAEPMIEGAIQGDRVGWKIHQLIDYGVSFVLAERA